jgi:hypothetical protein
MAAAELAQDMVVDREHREHQVQQIQVAEGVGQEVDIMLTAVREAPVL